MRRRITDPYEVLGLERGATDAEVRAAHLRLAKKHHPDKNAGDKASEWIFKEVQSAYETLRDAEGVRPGGQQGPPPSPPDRAERDQRDGAEHDRPREQHSERPAREKRGAGSRAQPTLFHQIVRWSKWAVYCSNAFLWPSVLAGQLEGLPEQAEWLLFYWMMLGPCVLAWDVGLKSSIKDAVEQFRRSTQKRH